MKAVILAGGKGTRLRPLTYAVPKPLLPINQRPMLEHILLHLKQHGITEIIIAVGYLGYQIKNYFGDGSELGINITYSEEKEALGTAGCLAKLKDELNGEPFLVMGGDNLTNLDITDFMRFHNEKKGIASIALVEIEVPVEYGVADLEDDKSILRFREKPVFKYNASTMLYCLNPEIFDFIEEGKDFAKDIFPFLLSRGYKIFGYSFNDLWIDVGRMDDFNKANERHAEEKPKKEKT
ncbi:MAG: nucleotidyltransferase family protein [Candidatus Aenigmarchaeota archaeon]|nr:nucleotidyltransferase family protein [Candidatus Aenigmarchaeota archaeon]